MTFKETTFPNLLNDIERVLESKNPLLAVEILKEIFKISKQIPVYPGIVSMCIPEITKKSDKELKVGEKLYFEKDGKIYLGTISEINEKVSFKEVQVLNIEKNLEFNKDDLDFTIFNDDSLKKLWPTLVYEENE